MAACAIASTGCAMVVKCGWHSSASRLSSKPMIDRLSGTARPACAAARSAPTAIASLVQKIAVRPGWAASRSAAASRPLATLNSP